MTSNAYQSPAAIRRNIEQVYGMQQGTLPIYQQFLGKRIVRYEEELIVQFADCYKLQTRGSAPDVVAKMKAKIMKMQAEIHYMHTLFKLMNDSESSDNGLPSQDVIDSVVEKLLAENNHVNQSNGHHYNVSRKRQKPTKPHNSGKGFKYRPELASRRRGNGEFSSENYDDSYSELEEELDSTTRYDRGYHPQQSLPKIDWQNERKWRNNGRKRRRVSSEESRKVRRAHESMNWIIDKNGVPKFRRKKGKKTTPGGICRTQQTFGGMWVRLL